MNKKIIVRQNSFKDCGPSCLLSIMKYYNVEVSHEELTLKLKMDREGTNAYNIINVSKLYGFDGYGIHYTVDDIINNFEVGTFYMPNVITTTKTFEDVITALENKQIAFSTPNIGSTFNLESASFKTLYVGEDISFTAYLPGRLYY